MFVRAKALSGGYVVTGLAATDWTKRKSHQTDIKGPTLQST